MELNLTNDVIRINETVFNGNVEQTIEQDYALPDYYPGIFKVLNSTIQSSVYNCRISGQKLVVDGLVTIKIIYQNEEDNKIHSIWQKYPFSKTVDIKEDVQNPVISYSTTGDYINCRVVNPKRIDLRGAVTVHITVIDQREVELLSGADGDGVQIYRGMISNTSSHLNSSKQFTVEDQFEMPQPVEEIVNYKISSVPTECKIITNKLVTKGEMVLHMLCRGSDDELLTVNQRIPISQIIDMPGVDEEYKCDLIFNNTDAELRPESEEGTTNVFASFSITAMANAYAQRDVAYVKDAFSTAYEAETEARDVVSENLAHMIDTTVNSKQQIELQNISRIIDLTAEISNITAVISGESLHLTGDLQLEIMVVDNEDNTNIMNRSIPIECDLPENIDAHEPMLKLIAKVLVTNFELNENQLNIEAEFRLSGSVFSYDHVRAISNLNIDESKPKDNSEQSALSIYYADAGEHLWDISKKYNTSMDAVMVENSLDSPVMENRIMLLIPIVD